jgi:hypothetical protein
MTRAYDPLTKSLGLALTPPIAAHSRTLGKAFWVRSTAPGFDPERNRATTRARLRLCIRPAADDRELHALDRRAPNSVVTAPADPSSNARLMTPVTPVSDPLSHPQSAVHWVDRGLPPGLRRRQKSTSAACRVLGRRRCHGLLIRRFWVRIPGGALRRIAGQRRYCNTLVQHTQAEDPLFAPQYTSWPPRRLRPVAHL